MLRIFLSLTSSIALLVSPAARAGEFLVKTKPSSFYSTFAIAGVHVLDRHAPARLLKVDIETASETAALAKLRANPEVEYVVPNIQLQTEAVETDANTLALSEWWLKQVNAEGAWQVAGNQGSRTVTVAVLDTGVDYTHPALRANMVPGFDFTTNKAGGMDFNDHGTHCAGIIGAGGAAVGAQMSGIVPTISIMPLRFLNNTGGGSLYDGIRAADYAIAQHVDVISASWGAELSAPDLEKPLTEMVERTDRAGVIFVAATGNHNRDNDQIKYFPSNAQFPTMIAVAATGPDDAKIAISNYGEKNVHIAAPGSDIVSTIRGGSYKSLTGTSMATPLVAGLVALMKAQNPHLQPADYRRILQETGHPANVVNACHCRIDAEAAVKKAIELR